jgi:hypothetical protein
MRTQLQERRGAPTGRVRDEIEGSRGELWSCVDGSTMDGHTPHCKSGTGSKRSGFLLRH